LTSDIIESLFGKFKYIAKSHSMSEINKLTLALPCICGSITPELIGEIKNDVTTKDLDNWINDEIGQTLMGKRRSFFCEGNSLDCGSGQESAGTALLGKAQNATP